MVALVVNLLMNNAVASNLVDAMILAVVKLIVSRIIATTITTAILATNTTNSIQLFVDAQLCFILELFEPFDYHSLQPSSEHSIT